MQMDIAGLQVLAKSAHQGQRAHAPRDQIGDSDPGHSPGKSDGQRLREKLKKDVPLLRAQRLLHADFPGPLLH